MQPHQRADYRFGYALLSPDNLAAAAEHSRRAQDAAAGAGAAAAPGCSVQ